MSELSYEEATHLLTEHGGYDWLLTGQAFWSVREIAESLNAEGMHMGDDAIYRRIKDLPHTQNFGGPVGLKASKRDLIFMFASLMNAGNSVSDTKRIS